MYNYVVNRGEYIKEIIKNIVIKGEFWFRLKEKDCDVGVDYKYEGKIYVYLKSYFNDLRSRVFLIINIEEK